MRCEVWGLGRDPIVVVQQHLVLVDAILRREVADASELLDHRLLAQRQRLQRDGERGASDERVAGWDVGRDPSHLHVVLDDRLQDVHVLRAAAPAARRVSLDAALGLQPVEHEPLDHLRHVVARQLAVGLVVVDDDLLEEFRHPRVQPLAVDEDLGELVELREEEAEDRRRAEVHL